MRMIEQRHASERAAGSAAGRGVDPAANRLLIRGATVFFTGALVFSSAAFIGALGNDIPYTEDAAYVPPGLNCDSPVYCAEPTGTVDPPSGMKLFATEAVHDVKAMAASALAPNSAAAKHVPEASGGCACPACCGSPTQKELERQAEDIRSQIVRSAVEGRRP
jgi:hypothetical protein